MNIALQILAFIITSLLAGALVYFLWNFTIPNIIPGTNDVTFLQAVCLKFLFDILFVAKTTPKLKSDE